MDVDGVDGGVSEVLVVAVIDGVGGSDVVNEPPLAAAVITPIATTTEAPNTAAPILRFRCFRCSGSTFATSLDGYADTFGRGLPRPSRNE